MITEELFETYYAYLEQGKRRDCAKIVSSLLARDIELHQLYAELLARSMIRIGRRWQRNEISVATEHLATSITEGLLNLVYPRLFEVEKNGRNIVMACVANEHHQIGAKMVADTFELHGWDSYFVGSNTPTRELLRIIAEKSPDVVGLSVSQFFNLSSLKTAILKIRAAAPATQILVGGQAFKGAGEALLSKLGDVRYFRSVGDADSALKGAPWA